MMPLTLKEVAAACSGRFVNGDPAVVVSRVSTDSRSLQPGDLFIGLQGEHFDGDAFAAKALQAGAAAVVVREEAAASLSKRAATIIVDGGLAALSKLAAETRRRSRARVVAITGSIGKTSTKDMLAALLQPVAHTVATKENFNNEVGVPLTVLSIDEETEVVVVELAMRGVGQIADLSALVRPDVGVITNVAPVHLELVGTIERVARVKAELLSAMTGGTAVVPAKEPLLQSYVRRFGGRVVTFGDETADVFVVEAEQRGDAAVALIDAFGRRARFTFNFSGSHYLQDATIALAAFVALGYRLEEAKVGAARVKFSRWRGEVSDLPGGGLLLNDAYNASPLSMEAALDHVVSLAEGRPMVAILGDMYELGSSAADFHHSVGAYAAQRGVRVLAVGELARNYLTGRSDERWFATVEDCLEALRRLTSAPAGPSSEAAPTPRETASDRARTVSQAFLAKQARRTQRRKNLHDKDA